MRRLGKCDGLNTEMVYAKSPDQAESPDLPGLSGRCLSQDLKDASEPYRKMVMETIDKARVTFGGSPGISGDPPWISVAFLMPTKEG